MKGQCNEKTKIIRFITYANTQITFLQGFRKKGTVERVALLLIKNARKQLKALSILLINIIYQKPPRNSKQQILCI